MSLQVLDRKARPRPSVRELRAALTSGVARNRLWGAVFVLPLLVLFVVFKFYPMVQAFWLSLNDYDLLTPPRFSGLRNYVSLVGDPLFRQSAGATAYYVVGTCVPLWVLSLGAALAFNQAIPAKNILRAAFFMPVIMPAIVVAIIWKFLYHPYGLVNTGLQALGLAGVDWLSDSTAVMPAFILAGEWRLIPYFMIIYLAGLQAIPQEYYEAASIDGASSVQRFRHITLPLLRPTILLVIIVSVILTSKVFVNALVITNGGPNGATRVVPLFIYQHAFTFFKMGLASAASVVLLLVLMIFTIVQLRLFSETDDPA
jgi:multiple sugar transport system permease protein